MGQSKLELAVGTGQWDAGLKRAQQALNAFTQSQGGLQQALEKDSGDMRTFIQMMSKMDSTANTSKGQMNDYKRVLEQLTSQYNQMSDAQKKSSIGQDYLNTIEQLKQKFQQAKQQVDEFNRSLGDTNNIKLADIGSGGLFGGGKLDGMLQVFGGNLMTKAAGAIASLGTEMADMVKQGVELARQGEGIRIAFERLGRGDILNGLREATHGTVTDLELMKAAVKFNDFKLPVEELGTMLAFAQQKAKDTGQSIDYMVDSIVTGLGRKSLMILDNLGLSAAEIKEKMKETGDMTKAVGEIIREQMSQAGEYIETAADRATKADVELKNAMEELGRTFQPLTDAGTSMWNSLKVGALNLLNDAVKPLIQALTEAGRLQKQIESINKGKAPGQSALEMLRQFSGSTESKESLYNRQVARYAELEEKAWRAAQKAKKAYDAEMAKGGATDAAASYYKQWKEQEARAKAWRTSADAYKQGAKDILNPPTTPTTPTSDTTNTKTTKGGSQTNKEQTDRDRIMSQWLNAQAKLTHDITFYDGQVMLLADAQKLMEKKTREQEAATKKLTDAETERANALKANDLKSYLAANKKVTAANGEAAMSLDFTYTPANLDAFIANLKERISQANIGSELFDSLNAQLADAQSLANVIKTSIENGIDAAQFDPQEIFKKIFGDGKTAGDYIGNKWWQAILNTMTQQSGKKFSLDTRSGAVTTAKGGKDGVEQFMGDFSKITGSISNIASGIQNLGIEIPDGLSKTIGVLQTMSGILTGILTITTLIQATETAKGGFDVLTGLAKVGLMAIGMNHGGIVPKAASGYYVPGRRTSGDTTPILANAGELVLNKSSQSNLAAMIRNAESLVGMIDRYQNSFLSRAEYGSEAANFSGGAMQNLRLSASISGEQIRLVLNNNGRRTGRGEYVTSNFTRG